MYINGHFRVGEPKSSPFLTLPKLLGKLAISQAEINDSIRF